MESGHLEIPLILLPVPLHPSTPRRRLPSSVILFFFTLLQTVIQVTPFLVSVALVRIPVFNESVALYTLLQIPI